MRCVGSSCAMARRPRNGERPRFDFIIRCQRRSLASLEPASSFALSYGHLEAHFADGADEMLLALRANGQFALGKKVGPWRRRPLPRLFGLQLKIIAQKS